MQVIEAVFQSIVAVFDGIHRFGAATNVAHIPLAVKVMLWAN
jgi:hypothetical protein